VANRWVVNASPIISLVKIDRIHLLGELCDEVIIPQGVRDEITLGGYADSAVNWLQQAGQQFIQPAPATDSRIASWDLGLGESQVLSWAMTDPEYEAILDDLAARKAAKILQIPVRGTLAIILLAKQMGYIASVKQDFEKLMQVGLRISPTILAQAIALAEEQ
jgi:predicted nucleic acid-binding protein